MTQNQNRIPSTPLPIAVLISGNGSNLQALIDYQIQHPELYDIKLVISNKADAYGLERATQAKIATQILDHRQFESREAFDQQVQAVLDNAGIQLVILAGFMRILSQGFTEHFLGRMLNIHPSLLPKYQGLNTHQRAIDAGDYEHGLSVHFVTPELDGGPVILQAKTAIHPEDSATSLQQRIHTLEHRAYPQVVEWFAQNRLTFKNNELYFDGQTLTTPLLLTEAQ